MRFFTFNRRRSNVPAVNGAFSRGCRNGQVHSAILKLVALGALLTTPMQAKSVTVSTKATMSVSAIVTGGCIANLSLLVTSEVRVTCPMPTPFAIRTISNDDVSSLAGRSLIEVQY